MPEGSIFADATSLIGNSQGLNFGVPALDEFSQTTIFNSPETELSGFVFSSAELDSISNSLPNDIDQAAIDIQSNQPSFTSMLEENDDDVENIVIQ